MLQKLNMSYMNQLVNNVLEFLVRTWHLAEFFHYHLGVFSFILCLNQMEGELIVSFLFETK